MPLWLCVWIAHLNCWVQLSVLSSCVLLWFSGCTQLVGSHSLVQFNSKTSMRSSPCWLNVVGNHWLRLNSPVTSDGLIVRTLNHCANSGVLILELIDSFAKTGSCADCWGSHFAGLTGASFVMTHWFISENWQSVVHVLIDDENPNEDCWLCLCSNSLAHDRNELLV